jgi:NADH-quinone oxidoreductase subunit N
LPLTSLPVSWNFRRAFIGDMFRTNALTALEKNLLNLGVLIISLQSYVWLKSHLHLIEFYLLLLATLLGMFFMISSQNILMFYLGLELSSIPLAAMCNFDLDKKRSSEGAMKFIMSSAFSSGILLFGISMLYGATGSLNFTLIAQQLNGSPLQVFLLSCSLPVLDSDFSCAVSLMDRRCI